ncbi:CYTH domain-containing protein [Pedobacter psychrotolerans]|uniref:CYTH domain-containing protein n=1 Tax=Pedobacter psychrotolerans TaxID=1843235 RepID=A0A4R2H9B5_9SPHI|nr:CYTH domain-containing protein [Pedobacter psychrotolerans]TCO23617.1 CYTH domain-containing protein [Pedobacter psychrotolerans]GGE61344.1 CYTH domain-containing protein [Pedobacter psychrotolerans]
MGIEIERKFLLHHDAWNKLVKPVGKSLRQGYILNDPAKTIRVRIAETKAWLTIKGITLGASRLEYEYEIPLEEAKELLDNFSEGELDKIRYEIDYQGKTWEVDVFSGDNDGLIVAEIELLSEDEDFECPEWIGVEVTGDKRYYNASLTTYPFKDWTA